MPRIPPSALRQAYRISPHAAALLPACRDLPSALNELRWIREHVRALRPASAVAAELQVASLCRRRGRGEPLQYVLGTQPFGNLEMKCRPGVLIPRPEPEAYTTHLATILGRTRRPGTSSPAPLRILDLCTGTGCIALLLGSLLSQAVPDLCIRGVDISPDAVALSRENLRYNIGKRLLLLLPGPRPPAQTIAFSRGDVFSDALLKFLAAQGALDVLVCNPPYVSHWGFNHQTARSVRNYEPKIAQVPMIAYPGTHRPEDVFYARLLDVAARLRPRVMLFEVGDLDQALRVVEMALHHDGLLKANGGAVKAEIWRDWPDAAPGEEDTTSACLCNGTKRVRLKGSGHGRSVFIQCRGV